ncbi:MAG: Hpt domain-containing protein [Verrucomicrobiae bacterium]|jgi:HPt (histidine-containing phosphotransfer) domain-containing protein|nr:Hpt domain-containing protein [Verrucomicrobiae bacterium]
MTEPATLDESALARLRELGGDEFANDMVRMFHQYAEAQLGFARAALDAGDIDAVEKAIHPLKTSAAHVGALAMKGLCQEIENCGREGDGAPIPGLLGRLEAAYSEVKPLLAVVDKDPGA